jgi:hypothetical protein
MTPYTTGYAIRYRTPSIEQQAEFAVVTAADQIKHEDSSTPNHANRIAWAGWIDSESALGTMAFMWPIALNPAIQAALTADPTGGTVLDSDIQFVVNSNLEFVIAAWVTNKPA